VRLILDSTVIIDALRGRPAVERLRSHHDVGDDLATTAINVDEVVRGLLDHERERAQRIFDGLLLVPLGRREGWQAGTWRRDFSSRGITLSQPDCLVAAAALTAEARLATGNPNDFPMTEIAVEFWPVGS
jgi:predicted nucleic acid-binding protein